MVSYGNQAESLKQGSPDWAGGESLFSRVAVAGNVFIPDSCLSIRCLFQVDGLAIKALRWPSWLCSVVEGLP